MWCTFLRIHAVGESVVFLLQNDRTAIGHIALRSMLESFVDLQCLSDDQSYVNVIRRAEAESDLKYLKNYNPKNPYYQNMSIDDVKTRREELQGRINVGKKMSVEEKFKKSGNLDIYHTVYSHLNPYVHGSVATFIVDYYGLNDGKYKNTTRDFLYATSVKFCIASAVEISNKVEFAKPYLTLFDECYDESKELWK